MSGLRADRARGLRPLWVALATGVLLLAGCGDAASGRGGGAGSAEPATDAAGTPTDGAAADAAVERAPAEEVAAGLPSGGRAVGQPGRGDFPDVIDVKVLAGREGRVDVSVTLSSPYDTPERYADAWRVITPEGEVIGVRELTHDHADEQPFTRSLPGVQVPEGVTVLIIEGRDSQNGWGGRRWQIPVPD